MLAAAREDDKPLGLSTTTTTTTTGTSSTSAAAAGSGGMASALANTLALTATASGEETSTLAYDHICTHIHVYGSCGHFAAVGTQDPQSERM